MNIQPNKNNLIAIVLAGVILTIATYIFVGKIRENAETRLKTEMAITATWNEQYLSEIKFKERLKREAEEREFNRFLYGSSVPPPAVTLQRIEKQLREGKK